MKDEKIVAATDIFAPADRELFASINEVVRIEVENNRLKLYLKKKPARNPPLWLQKIACLLSDPNPDAPYKTAAMIVGIVDKDGETYLLSKPLRNLPLSEAMAKSLSPEATLVLRSPYGREHTLNFHTLFRAEKKIATQQT